MSNVCNRRAQDVRESESGNGSAERAPVAAHERVRVMRVECSGSEHSLTSTMVCASMERFRVLTWVRWLRSRGACTFAIRRLDMGTSGRTRWWRCHSAGDGILAREAIPAEHIEDGVGAERKDPEISEP